MLWLKNSERDDNSTLIKLLAKNSTLIEYFFPILQYSHVAQKAINILWKADQLQKLYGKNYLRNAFFTLLPQLLEESLTKLKNGKIPGEFTHLFR